MSFYFINNEFYDSYGVTNPFGLNYTINNTYHHSSNTNTNSRVKFRHYSIDNLFHSFSFLNRNSNKNTDDTSSESKKSKKKSKNTKVHMRTLSSPSFLNNTSTSNFNDKVDKIELSRYHHRYSDLIDSSSVYQPTINVEEKETQYHIAVYLPDVKKNEVKVEMCGDNIFIYGERGRKSKKYANFTKFNRMFTVPNDADCSSINVNFQNHILEIIFQKKIKTG